MSREQKPPENTARFRGCASPGFRAGLPAPPAASAAAPARHREGTRWLFLVQSLFTAKYIGCGHFCNYGQ